MAEAARRPRSKLRRLLVWSLVLFTSCASLGAGGLAGMLWYYGRDLKAIDEAALRAYQPPQITRIYAADKETLLGEYFTQRRTLIQYEYVPSHVENAFLAAEDADFYRHEGLDYLGILRALFINVRAGEIRQGASTITQQVVKNFILSPERTFKRKVHELLLSRRLERVLSKQEILELYLNEIYLGHGRYGIQEASRFYFGKDVQKIDAGQAALLATLPKAPGASTPHKAPERAKARQRFVLSQMAKHGFLSATDAERYASMPLAVQPLATARARVFRGAESFVDVVLSRLRSRFGDDLATLGATVVTTLDPDVQRAASRGLQAQLRTIDARQKFAHKIQPASDRAKLRVLKRGVKIQKDGQIGAVVIRGKYQPEGSERQGFEAALGERSIFVEVPPGGRYAEPEVPLSTQFPEGGITVARVSTPPTGLSLPKGWLYGRIASGPEAAVVVASVEDASVVAMVSGYEETRGGFNRAVAAKRQPGSTFKPFVYGAAVESRAFTAASVVIDSPEIYEKWRPTNFERDRYRGEVRLREALTHSVNTIAIKLLDAIGVPAGVDFARRAGIESALTENLSLALGTSEVTPFELLRAYTTLARGGTRRRLRVIDVIEIDGGEVVPELAPAAAVIAPEVAFVVSSLMASVVQEGTGRRAKKLGFWVAGKTGTAAENRDAWFAGFSRSHAAVAWVGFDRPKPLGRGETGGKAALPIWMEAMKAAVEAAKGDTSAPIPPRSVEVRTIDKQSGLLATSEAESDSVMEEYFLPGTAPTAYVSKEVLDVDAVALELLAPEEDSVGQTDSPNSQDAPPVKRPQGALQRATAPLPEPPARSVGGDQDRLPSVLDAP